MRYDQTRTRRQIDQSAVQHIVKEQILPLLKSHKLTPRVTNIVVNLETLKLPPKRRINHFLVLALEQEGYEADIIRKNQKKFLKIYLHPDHFDEPFERIRSKRLFLFCLMTGLLLYLLLRLFSGTL